MIQNKRMAVKVQYLHTMKTKNKNKKSPSPPEVLPPILIKLPLLHQQELQRPLLAGEHPRPHGVSSGLFALADHLPSHCCHLKVKTHSSDERIDASIQPMEPPPFFNLCRRKLTQRLKRTLDMSKQESIFMCNQDFFLCVCKRRAHVPYKQ